MAIKTVVADIEEVDESIRGLYVEEGGQYVLRVEGPAPRGYATAADFSDMKAKHETSRNNNIDLLKGVASLTGVEEATDLSPLRSLVEKYNGVDVDEYATLKSNAQKLEQKGVTQPDDIAEIVRGEVHSAVEPLKQELESERAARVAAQQKNDEAQLRSEISTVFLEAGGRPKALDFLVGQAESVFEVKEGSLVARSGNYSQKDAGEPLSVAEWIERQTQEADFIFGDSGGGAAPITNAADSLPPGVRVLRNPTEQELGKHSQDIADGKVKLVTS